MARPANSDGYATLAVLVVAGILASVVATLLLSSRPELALARLGASDAQADALLDGGLRSAGFMLVAAKVPPSEVDGTVLHFGAADIRLAAADESGRVDLNAAKPELLEGLFKAVGGSSLEPAIFAARVVDWRDEDDQPTERGAESFDYSAAGLSYGPRNGAFESVEELGLILGLSAADVARLTPYVTVFSGSAEVDPLSAPRTVLRAIPNLQGSEIERLLQARQARPIDENTVSGIIAAHADFFRDKPSGAYRVGIEAELAGGRRESADAVVVAAGEKTGEFGVALWRKAAVAGLAR